MGLIGKLSEMRMKDPVEGVLRITGITIPDSTATSANYRLDGVVSADGLMPTAIVHHGMAPANRWPSPGDELPVTVDRAKPERLVVHWKELPTGQATAQQAAQQLADQMRGGGTAAAAAASFAAPAGFGDASKVTVTVNGVPTNAIPADLLSTVQSALGGLVPAAAAEPPTVSNADILARGTAGSATLLGTFPSPVPVTKPGHTGVGLMLNVMIDGRLPFQVQNVYAVPDTKVTKLTPGALLPIKADLTNTNLVAIDWDAA
jgi:hypothetical protein